ncbi:MAG: cation diffusion facilitator family transporter [Bacteroidota bacterium]|nr:cation diffusion facilitator family transporter [Bacteroidota bacterium]
MDREEMTREKRRVAMTSVVAAIFLTAMKLAVGLWTGSLGILSEALHSGLDLLAATITVFAVRIADRPADEDHQFGHGKIENLSALLQTLLLLVTCVWILYEAWERLSGDTVHIQVNFWAFAVVIVSIAVDFSRSRALMRIARKYNSQALEADALHFRTDIYSSSVVLVGLVSVMIGFPEADAIAAAIVALIVIWISARLGRQTIDGLLDRVPDGLQRTVEEAVGEIDGVESIRSLRLRPSGGTVFVNLVIGIQRTTFFDRAHAVVDNVEESVRRALPRADILVHAEPVVGVREKLSDKVEWLVRQSGLTAHNIAILWVDDSYVIEFDIEYPQGTSFEEAHDLATEVEVRIREHIANVRHVHIHLEEDTVSALNARDISAAETALLQRCDQCLRAQVEVLDVRMLRLLATENGLRISATVALSRFYTLAEMHHVVDRLENGLAALDGRIDDIFIHAEPADPS